MNWFPFYSADFLGATIGLSFLERCAYTLMLVMYYELERPFPRERTRTYRILGAESDEQRRAIDHVLNEFFIRAEDGWYNKRAEEEFAKARNIRERKSEAGKLGNERRWRKDSEKQPQEHRTTDRSCDNTPIAEGSPPTPTPTPTSTPTTKEKESGTARPQRGTRLPQNWIPGPEGTTFCEEERPDLNPSEVLERFRDYWLAQPGQKGVKADWMATWRNWVRRETVRG